MRKFYPIFVVAVFAFVSLTGCEKAAGPKVEKATPAPAVATPKSEDPADNAPRMTLAEAKKEFDAGTATFVDTRAEVQFKTERVKGAVNMPMEAFEMRYKSIPTDKKIIAYCS